MWHGRLAYLASRDGCTAKLQNCFSTAARDGALIGYGPNYFDMYRRSASYIERILKGANPADLPVQQPTKFDFIVNLKTAKALGVTVPNSMLVRTDEVIR